MQAANTPPRIESPYIRSLIAGGIAGTTVDLSLYPLDTLKTRLQSASGFYASGGFRGIYAGVGSALVGSAPGAALFFVTYDSLKRALTAPSANRTATRGSGLASERWYAVPEPAAHMIAASVGEVAACAVRVPTEVVKQRAQARQAAGSLSALRDILAIRREVGGGGIVGLARVWREMYRGWTITVMREVPFTVIQFPLWEAMKAWRRSQGAPVSAAESAAFGSAAGAVAAGVTTPLDVLKTRMMLAKESKGLWVLLTDIIRDSGPRAFFAGIGPRIFWISSGGAIFLGSYQWAINALGGEP